LDEPQKPTERIIRITLEPPLRKKSFWRLRVIFAVAFLVAGDLEHRVSSS
jgi:hypothetical protein